MDADQRKKHIKARLFCPNMPAPAAEGELSDSIACEVPADQAKHARTVLRLKVGDQIELFNGKGVVGRGEIAVCSKRELVVSLTQVVQQEKEGAELVIATAVPKGARADGMIDELVQAGVDEVWPICSERSVVEPRKSKLEKLQVRAVEASKQSGRAWLMGVHDEMKDFAEVLEEEADLKLLLHFAQQPVADFAQKVRDAKRVILLIGPEGGWSDEEVELAKAKGWDCWTCGPHTMRIETAAVVGAGVIRYVAMNR